MGEGGKGIREVREVKEEETDKGTESGGQGGSEFKDDLGVREGGRVGRKRERGDERYCTTIYLRNSSFSSNSKRNSSSSCRNISRNFGGTNSSGITISHISVFIFIITVKRCLQELSLIIIYNFMNHERMKKELTDKK